jgi:hypothetical protein
MSVPGGKCRVLGIAGALVCRIDGRSLPISLHELCRESSLQLPCQGGRVGSVPGSLMPLNEALPTAIDLAGKVGSQRREAATELNFRSFPGWQRGLCGFRCSDVIRCRIWMAGVCILLNLDERFVLSCVVIFQARSVVQEISLKGFVSVLLLAAAQTRRPTPTCWVSCHCRCNLSSGTG